MTAIEKQQQQIAAAFSRHAKTYDSCARLQRTIAEHLDTALARFIAQSTDSIRTCIDIGCGTGALSTRLIQRFPQAKIQLYDIAPEMLLLAQQTIQNLFPRTEQRRVQYTLGNAEFLRFPVSVDVNASNFCAQWFHDPLEALRWHFTQSHYLGWSLLLDGSFGSWIAAHSAQPAGILDFITLSQLENTIVALAPKRYELQLSTHTIAFPTALDFLRELRSIGALTARHGYTPRPLRPLLRRFEDGFEAEYRIACIFLERS